MLTVNTPDASRTLFSIALDARAAWAMVVIARTAAGGVSTKEVLELTAIATDHAQKLGLTSYPATDIPNLISDVPELIQSWSDAFATASEVAAEEAYWQEMREVWELELEAHRGFL